MLTTFRMHHVGSSSAMCVVTARSSFIPPLDPFLVRTLYRLFTLLSLRKMSFIGGGFGGFDGAHCGGFDAAHCGGFDQHCSPHVDMHCAPHVDMHCAPHVDVHCAPAPVHVDHHGHPVTVGYQGAWHSHWAPPLTLGRRWGRRGRYGGGGGLLGGLPVVGGLLGGGAPLGGAPLGGFGGPGTFAGAPGFY